MAGLLEYQEVDSGLLDEDIRKKLAREMAHTYQGGANDVGPLATALQPVMERFTPQFWQQNYQDAKNTLSDLPNQLSSFPPLSRESMRNAPPATPEEQERIMSAMNAFGPSNLGLLGITAYHGSPHKFDKFKLDKIGTGEGAQAYGHGLYFAENPGVATSYKTGGGAFQSGPSVNIDNVLIGDQWARQFPRKSAESQAATAFGNDLFGKSIQEKVEKLRSSNLDEAASFLEKNADKFSVSQGNLYKVDISDDAVKNFLDWDKPLSQQPEIVRKLVPELFEMQKKIAGGMKPGEAARSLGLNPAYGHMDQGSLIYEILQDKHGADKASMLLKKAGIPGIRYLDQGSRDTTQRWIAKHPKGGENSFNTQEALEAFIKRNPEYKAIEPKTTSNFVVFDEDIVKVLDRNGKGLLE